MNETMTRINTVRIYIRQALESRVVYDEFFAPESAFTAQLFENYSEDTVLSFYDFSRSLLEEPHNTAQDLVERIGKFENAFGDVADETLQKAQNEGYDFHTVRGMNKCFDATLDAYLAIYMEAKTIQNNTGERELIHLAQKYSLELPTVPVEVRFCPLPMELNIKPDFDVENTVGSIYNEYLELLHKDSMFPLSDSGRLESLARGAGDNLILDLAVRYSRRRIVFGRVKSKSPLEDFEHLSYLYALLNAYANMKHLTQDGVRDYIALRQATTVEKLVALRRLSNADAISWTDEMQTLIQGPYPSELRVNELYESIPS